MSLSTQKIQWAFNKAAAYYHEVTPVQKKMGEKLVACLPQRCFHQVIDLGCGTGWTTQRLANHIAFSEFDAIDMSEAMIDEANHMNQCLDIQFKTQSFDVLSENHYDLVFSNMALHWSIDFVMTLQHVYNALKSGGLMAFSLPLLGTFNELAPYCSTRHFYSADVISDMLLEQKFNLKSVQCHHELLVFDHTLQALRTLKQSGATVCDVSLPMAYKQCRLAIKKDCVKQLSYHIGLFMAEKI